MKKILIKKNMRLLFYYNGYKSNKKNNETLFYEQKSIFLKVKTNINGKIDSYCKYIINAK